MAEQTQPKDAHVLLVEWRKRVDRTQTACAKEVDVRQATWAEWEAGRKKPQIKYAIRIQRMTENEVPVTAWEPGEDAGAEAEVL